LNENKNISSDDLIGFHTGSYTDDKSNDMLMQRNTLLKTISVSQVNISAEQSSFVYKDLEQQKTHYLNLDVLCKTV